MSKAKWRQFDSETIARIVANSRSWDQMARALGYADASGSFYSTLKRMVKELHLSTDHFLGRGWRAGQTDPTRFRRGVKLKEPLKALVSLRGHRCERCGLTEWLGEPIPLEVHHIDHDILNNTLENLQVLCRNCHGLTEGFAGKNNTGAPKLSDEELVEILRQAPNIRQGLIMAGLTARGANYSRAYKLAVRHGLTHLFSK